MKFRYILFTLFCIITLSFKVNAYTNLETTYNIDIPNYKEQLEQKTCGNTNLSETFQYLVNSINWDTSYYQMFVARPYHNSSIPLRLYFKTTTSFENQNLWVRGRNNSNYFQISPYNWNYDGGYFDFSFSSCSSSLDVNNSQIIQQLINLIQNGTAMTITYDVNIGNRSTGLVQNLSFDYVVNYQFNNNSSYTIPFWYFYNSFKWNYAEPSNTSIYYYKTLYFVNEDKTYTFNNPLDSYYDLHYNQQPTFIGYKTSLDTFYTSLDPNNFNNYSLKVKFNVPQSILGYSQDPQDYVDNTYFNYYCSGRINNSNYYSYEQFPCSLSNSYSISGASVEYTFNNLSTSNNLSNYDKIFITIRSNYYDNNINTIVNSFSYTYNLGSFYNSSFKGTIYESFNSLPLNFKLYVSSNNDPSESNLYVKKYNFINYNIKYAGFSNETTNQNAVVGISILGNIDDSEDNTFLKLNITSQNDSGFLIYQDNGSIIIPSLDLVFNNGFILSFNNTSSDEFYYIDSDGNIDTNNYILPVSSEDNNYDLTYYIDKVNSFIDDLSEECIEFSQLTQSFYNGLPVIFQSFLFVLFILACCYFTYLLINRR